MTSALARFLCRLLAVLMIWTPYQLAHAGMLGAADAAAAAASTSAQSDRGTVLAFATRADVASQLQSLGIDPQAAAARVAALSDAELRTLASGLQSLPAGADAGGIAFLIILIIGIWWFWRT